MADGPSNGCNEYQVIPQIVLDKLETVFSHDIPSYTRVLTFLMNKQQQDNQHYNRVIQIFEHAAKSKKSAELFRNVALQLVEDAKKEVDDKTYHAIIGDLWQKLLLPSDGRSPAQNDEEQLQLMSRATGGSMHAVLARTISRMPPATARAVVRFIQQIVTTTVSPNAGALVSATLGKSLQLVGKKQLSTVILAVPFLAYEIVQNIRRWWKDEITGKRCIKNILDYSVALAAGISGGVAGAYVGGIVGGPIGAAVGSLVGGVLASEAAGSGIDIVTRYFFDLPKDVAVERAYNTLGVRYSDSNYAVNSAYRRLCLKHHPDKGGNKEDYYRAQFAMEIIRQHRHEN